MSSFTSMRILKNSWMNGELKGILEKYCKFLPVEIKFGTKEESVEDGVDAEGKPKYKTVTVDQDHQQSFSTLDESHRLI